MISFEQDPTGISAIIGDCSTSTSASSPSSTYVALAEGQMVGTYYLKPNQPGLGSHVCNAGYMVKGQEGLLSLS